MAGLHEIVRSMLLHCPHCNKPIDLTEFTTVLFQRVLDVLSTGERVFVTQFGTFTAKRMKGWTVKSFGRGEHTFGSRRVIRFRAARNAKEMVNSGPEKGVDDERDNAAEPKKGKAKASKANGAHARDTVSKPSRSQSKDDGGGAGKPRRRAKPGHAPD